MEARWSYGRSYPRGLPQPYLPERIPDLGFIKRDYLKPEIFEALYEYPRLHSLIIKYPCVVRERYKGNTALEKLLSRGHPRYDKNCELLYAMGGPFVRSDPALRFLSIHESRWRTIFKYITSAYKPKWGTHDLGYLKAGHDPELLRLYLNDGPTLAERCLFVLECTKIRQEIEAERKRWMGIKTI